MKSWGHGYAVSLHVGKGSERLFVDDHESVGRAASKAERCRGCMRVLRGRASAQEKARRGGPDDVSQMRDYSHSMVPGGLLVMSITTRFIPRTSLVIRPDIRSSTS